MLALDAVSVAGDRAQKVLRLLPPHAGAIQPPAVRSRADAHIVAIAPIGEIVAALLAGPGMIGHLVGGQPRRERERASELEQRGGAVGIIIAKLTLGGERGEAGAGLDGELVEREVAGAEAERTPELRFPGRRALFGPGIDQVEADTVESGLGGVERRQAFRDIMRPTEKMQRSIVERLNTKRYAIDACAREIGEARGFNRGRIGFERDLDIGRKAPKPLRRLDQRGDGGGRHQRRRAAAEEDRAERPARCQRGFMRQVGEERIAPYGLVDGRADMAVEVAIGAFRDAERPMDVEG